jgi:hypothetical protein
MLELEEVRRRLKDRILLVVSKESGVKYQVIWKLVHRKTTDRMEYATVKKLSDYLEKNK